MEEVSESMDSAELSGWMAFDQVHGMPDTVQRGILRALTVLCNLWSSKHKFTPEDFTGCRKRPRRRMSEEVMKANALAIIRLREARGLQ